MYYLLLTLWLSQPEVEKKNKVKERRPALQDNINQTGLTVSEKIDTNIGKEDGNCQ